jgi:CBS domain-containing protein
MTVGEALRICIEHGIPGIPFVDAGGRISGRFSVRHIFKISSLPDDVVRGAHLIGHEAIHLEYPCDHFAEVFRQPIDNLILPQFAHMSSDALVAKAMALMEKFNSGYMFVIDDGHYKGVVTRLGLTRLLLDANE